jgi:chemotaxis protein CheX
MAENYAAPFINSFISILPQLGFENIHKGVTEEAGKIIDNQGVIVILGIVGDLRGNVLYGMSESCAKKIASTMMMGMEVTDFDAMAQSAVSELTNMITATASTELTGLGIKTDISTPTLMYGDFNASASYDNVLRVEMLIGDDPFNIYISLEKS